MHAFFWLEYNDNDELHYDVERAEYFFLHSPQGHIMLEEEGMVPFVKGHWYWWPNPRKNRVVPRVFNYNWDGKHWKRGLHFTRLAFWSNIKCRCISSTVDDYHHVPINIKLGTRKLHRHQIWVVIESRRRLAHDVESINIIDAFRRIH